MITTKPCVPPFQMKHGKVKPYLSLGEHAGPVWGGTSSRSTVGVLNATPRRRQTLLKPDNNRFSSSNRAIAARCHQH